jgi:hypothetical protein
LGVARQPCFQESARRKYGTGPVARVALMASCGGGNGAPAPSVKADTSALSTSAPVTNDSISNLTINLIATNTPSPGLYVAGASTNNGERYLHRYRSHRTERTDVERDPSAVSVHLLPTDPAPSPGAYYVGASVTNALR